MTAVNLATAEEFHQEIARLQAEIERLRLTDAEREAVDAAAATFDASDYPHANRKADTLRGLLERTR